MPTFKNLLIFLSHKYFVICMHTKIFLGRMDSSGYSQNICRICLGSNIKLNWNEIISELCGISYKDCYYKYTKLEETDQDFYPTNLCDKCAGELKNAHILFERALETFNILQDLGEKCFDSNKNKSLSALVTEYDDKTMINTEEYCISFLDENVLSNASKIKQEEPTIEPTHFIDIENLGSPTETAMEFSNSEVLKSAASKSGRKKKRKYDFRCPVVLEQETSNDNFLFTTKKTRRNKKVQSFDENSLNKEANDDCDYELLKNKAEDTKKDAPGVEKSNTLDHSALENSAETSTTKPARKYREKCIFICSYCSLQVYGAKNIEKHEATHDENRERTATCPHCELKYYNDFHLRVHMKIHDKNRQKKHKCEFCEKAFFNKGGLNVHRRIHLGLMIKCNICEKEFYRQIDLNKHLLKHAASPSEKHVGRKRYVAQCQYCNKSVLTVKYKEHIAVHMNEPQVKCKICDKNFFSRLKCTRHLRRFHLKNSSEFEEFIHYYVDRNKRLSSLMIKQQLEAQPLKE